LLDELDIEDKIVLLRIRGELEHQKTSDIKFSQIEEFAKQKKVYFMLRNTHDLKTKDDELEIEVLDKENIEEETVKIYSEQNPSDFNKLIPELINSLAVEKQEGETTDSFTNRLMETSKKIMRF